ncbi:uncharacterized protein si:dkey-65b12.12 isoform X2 [Triplophysa dalaica]|uniref:uncharacterized protein si:dkey-65b12.12 isoform X2 n=1 Tax=Triplophysa dalaica TaxID=1582913 RepID=UPI0024DFA117|nr:uncharacterized protein si:dkey-65b12.12 isoform X2 [Triplophysa dalaica]
MCVNIIWRILHLFIIYITYIHDLLESNKTEGTSVVWIQNTTANPNIVEITLEGESKFWNDRGGRIKTFPKLKSELPDFSILIHNVQQSDLGHYWCKLYIETFCLLAFVNIDLQEAVVSDNTVTWLILPAATGGGIVLLVSLIICKLVKRQKNTREVVYENTSEIRKTKSINKKSIVKNITSEPAYVNTSDIHRTASIHKERTSCNNPIYSSVEQQ